MNDNVEGGCWIDLDASGVEHKPHLVDKNDTIVAPQLIDGKRIVQLAAGQTVTLACEGNGNVLMVTNHQINDATCLSGATLQVRSVAFVKEVSPASNLIRHLSLT